MLRATSASPASTMHSIDEPRAAVLSPLRLMSTESPMLGIDIGGTKLAVALAMPDGHLLAERREPSRAAEGPDAMIFRVTGMARAAAVEAGVTLDEVG